MCNKVATHGADTAPSPMVRLFTFFLEEHGGLSPVPLTRMKPYRVLTATKLRFIVQALNRYYSPARQEPKGKNENTMKAKTGAC